MIKNHPPWQTFPDAPFTIGGGLLSKSQTYNVCDSGKVIQIRNGATELGTQINSYTAKHKYCWIFVAIYATYATFPIIIIVTVSPIHEKDVSLPFQSPRVILKIGILAYLGTMKHVGQTMKHVG